MTAMGKCSIAGKFGGELNLAVWQSTFATAKLNPPVYFLLAYVYIRMVIPYHLNPPIFFAMTILGPAAIFNILPIFPAIGYM